MKNAALIVIPARFASTRFPGKVLKLLGGRPIVEWCRRAAVRADVGPVVVATDDKRVLSVVTRAGGRAVLTGPCRSGSDRAYAALKIVEKADRRRYRVIVNLQGDEPFIRPSTIRKVAEAAAKGEIATAVTPARPSDARDPHVVKTAVAKDGRCLYFSRSPIPHVNGGGKSTLLQHIGIYGFSRSALERFVRLKPSALEKAERLEQLRALEAGMTIIAVRVKENAVGIDTPADLARAQKSLEKSLRRNK